MVIDSLYYNPCQKPKSTYGSNFDMIKSEIKILPCSDSLVIKAQTN